MLSPFRVLTPTSRGEAAAELRRLGGAAKVYAGGAELLLLLRHGLLEAEYLVDIKQIPGVRDIASDNGVVRIGAAASHRQLELDPIIRERLPVLAEAESQVGNVRVRAQGTLGGNLCFADPHADPATALLVHDTFVIVAGATEERRIPLGDFLVGTYETALAEDEIAAEILVQPLPANYGGAFLRIERFYRPTANVTVAVMLEDGRLAGVRLAAGCVGPKAMRLDELEAELLGLTLAEADRRLATSKAYLADQLEPVDDLLGSSEYKVHITSVLLRRGLRQAGHRVGGGQDA